MSDNNVGVGRNVFDGVVFHFDFITGFLQLFAKRRRAHRTRSHSRITDKRNQTDIAGDRLHRIFTFSFTLFTGGLRIRKRVFRRRFIQFQDG